MLQTPEEFPFLIGRIKRQTCPSFFFVLSRFPFLIGRIKSTTQSCFCFNFSSFPFLIGRIKSRSWRNCLSIPELFPFLIGRIKREYSRTPNCRTLKVSIPHRQDKKFFYLDNYIIFFQVSIPHRQDKKSSSLAPFANIRLSFHSSQVG